MNEEVKTLILRSYRLHADVYETEVRIEEKKAEILRLLEFLEIKNKEIEELNNDLKNHGVDPKGISFTYMLK